MKTRSAPRRRRTVDTPAYFAMVGRILAAAGARVAEADADDLKVMLELRAQLDEAILEAVRGLRDGGTTWEDIGAAAGITRQGAIRHWNGKL